MKNSTTSVTTFFLRVSAAFSVIIVFISIVGPLLGDTLQANSVLFGLGTQGIPYAVVSQALLLALYANAVQELFLSDFLFKGMMFLWRVVLMLVTVFVGCGALSALFGWFPADAPIAWISYAVCFGVSAGTTTLIMVIKTHRDDIRVNEKLEEYKRQRQHDDHLQKGE